MIRAENICKTIKTGGQEQIILNNISFNLEQGTVTAIIGKSGCGKSTLLSIMSGIDKPTSGKVFLNNKDFYSMDRKKQEKFRNENIGILFQNYHLIPELTCEENIRMPLAFSDKSVDNKKIKNMIKTVGLEKKRKLFPKQMSGGEQQRTALLRALVNGPLILYADEPTGALDLQTGNELINFLIKIAHTKKMTILLVTHDMDIAKQCDTILEMEDGKFI